MVNNFPHNLAFALERHMVLRLYYPGVPEYAGLLDGLADCGLYRLVISGSGKKWSSKSRREIASCFSLVIYNGKSPWKAPLKVSDLIDVPHCDLARFQLNQEYFVIDEQRLSQLQLDNAKGEASYIFRLERKNKSFNQS